MSLWNISLPMLNKVFLRSKTENPTTVLNLHPKLLLIFCTRVFCYIDTVWFIQIVESNCGEDRVLCDDYGHKIVVGVIFLKGHFLKKEKELSTTQLFKRSLKTTFFYSEDILYPYANLLANNKGFYSKKYRLYRHH